jgi:deoxycytidine triphosphate deaminase
MQLTGKQIVEEGIITNLTEKAIQQQGVDIRIDIIRNVEGMGRIPKEGKTILPVYKEIQPIKDEAGEHWTLFPGYYEIQFVEGCKIPSNRVMTIIQRSSLLRNGVIIRSSQYDAGFETEHMGTFMVVNNPVIIEKGARIAQTIILETADVDEDKLYNGQWQRDNQRK